MRLLVTGGSGFLGGYVLDEARRCGHEVVALTRSDKAADAVAKLILEGGSPKSTTAEPVPLNKPISRTSARMELWLLA